MHMPGFEELKRLDYDSCDDGTASYKGIVLKQGCNENHNTFFFCPGNAYETAESIPKPVGTAPLGWVNKAAVESAIKELCNKFIIPYREPQFYIGLYISV